MLELESRFPLLGRLSAPVFAVALAGAALAIAIACLGWTAARSIERVYGGYTELITETSAPKCDY